MLAAAPWPIARALRSATFRRLQGRRATVRYGGYLLAYSIVIAVAVARYPRLARAIAVAACLGTAGELWAERSSSGRRAGLPPGGLPLIPFASVTDRDYVLKNLVRHGPVVKAGMNLDWGPMICVRGLRRGASVLREHAEDLSWVGISFDPLIPAGYIRSMERDDHSRYTPPFRAAFAEETVDACAGYFRQEARRAVDDIRDQVTCDPGEAIDPRVMAGLVTVRSYARLFLGVLSETEHCAFVERMLLEPGPLYLQRRHGADELRDPAMALSEIVRSKSRDVADPEVANSFLGNFLRAEPQALDDPNVLLNLVFLLAASSRDVTGLLHWVVKMLGDNPIWIARVRLDKGDLDRRIVMETLRLAQSEYIARRVVRPFEIDGYRVPQGARLRICVNESHRDPAVFEAPETFDPDRFSGRRYTSAEYAPFGMLEHSCLGVPTTHVLAAAFVREYCEYDWIVSGDGEPEYDGLHWTPNRRLRITL